MFFALAHGKPGDSSFFSLKAQDNLCSATCLSHRPLSPSPSSASPTFTNSPKHNGNGSKTHSPSDPSRTLGALYRKPAERTYNQILLSRSSYSAQIQIQTNTVTQIQIQVVLENYIRWGRGVLATQSEADTHQAPVPPHLLLPR